MRFLPVVFGVLILPVPHVSRSAEDAKPADKVTLTREGEIIDPEGRFSDDLINKVPRYYVWHDAEGWHVRSTSQAGTFARFDGSIKLTGGTFNRLRPIGLEGKGKNPDKWQVSKDRTEITFEIATDSSFDGFDFTVNGKAARVAFDLNIAKKGYPNRIYVGKGGKHPVETKFDFAAAP
jgi:hypothetical protein